MNIHTVGFIGLGLIGGSIAGAIKHFHPNIHILAHSRSLDTLQYALDEGIIDEAYDVIGTPFERCDCIFLCAPVETNVSFLKVLKPLINQNCILTDVGSTKTDIHEKVIELGLQRHFIGGHPMAGSEKTGIRNAKWNLLAQTYYFLTPAAEISPQTVDLFEGFIDSLKAITIRLPYQEHDYITAAVSHMPHIIAASLVKLIKDSDSEQETMKKVAAGGFRDITRIASASPEIWTQICSTNTENIISVLDDFINDLISVKIALTEQDFQKIHTLFHTSRDYRDSIPESPNTTSPSTTKLS